MTRADTVKMEAESLFDNDALDFTSFEPVFDFNAFECEPFDPDPPVPDMPPEDVLAAAAEMVLPEPPEGYMAVVVINVDNSLSYAILPL